MQQFIPYLGFNGNCKEAMAFYNTVLGGTMKAMMRMGDMPGCENMPASSANRIMHGCLVLADDSHLYGGDAPEHLPYQGQHGVAITMAFPTIAEATRVFQAFADGGNVTMPLAPAFWSKIFGMVADKYGTSWAINGEPIPMP